MAFLRKLIDKWTYALIVGAFNAITVYVSTTAVLGAPELTLMVTVGNLVLVWMAVETSNPTPNTTPEQQLAKEQLDNVANP